MSTDVEVVRVGTDAWERVRATRLAALADAPDAFGVPLEVAAEDPPRAWKRRLAHRNRVTLLAEPVATWETGAGHATAAGLAFVGPAEGHPRRTAGIYSVWVAPWARGRGVGDAVMVAALEVARELGHRRAVLDVGDHNIPAQRLYARHGFESTGATSTLPPPRKHVTEHELARDL